VFVHLVDTGGDGDGDSMPAERLWILGVEIVFAILAGTGAVLNDVLVLVADDDGEIPVALHARLGDGLDGLAPARAVGSDDDLRDRAIEVVRRTRETDAVEFGASPRASMGLVVAAKARAFLKGRTHVSGEDVAAMAPPVLRHRVILDFEAERRGLTPDDVVRDLL